nr:MAG TPA: hypothetical protein [Caudoviricetes sp.]
MHSKSLHQYVKDLSSAPARSSLPEAVQSDHGNV